MHDASPGQLRRHREPAITVSMQDEQIVIRPQRRLDREATVVLNAVLNASVTAGTMTVLDLDGVLRSSATISAFAHRGVDDGAPAQEQRNEVFVAGLGCIRISSLGSWWTIDLERRRFCRSATPVDPRFVAASLWTGVRRLWLSSSTVAVLTTDDCVISAHRLRPAA